MRNTNEVVMLLNSRGYKGGSIKSIVLEVPSPSFMEDSPTLHNAPFVVSILSTRAESPKNLYFLKLVI